MSGRDEQVTMNRIIRAVVETIEDMGAGGAPEGPLFMGLQQCGYTLEAFQAIVRGLVEAKVISKRGNLLFIDQGMTKVQP